MEISIKQQDELYARAKRGKSVVFFIMLCIILFIVLTCLFKIIQDRSYTHIIWVVGIIVGSLVFGRLCMVGILTPPKLNAEYLEFASLKVNEQFIRGRVTKVEFSLDNSRPDMCKIYVTGDDGLNYSTVKWLELNNLLSTDLVSLKSADGRLTIADPEKIALVGRECCIYTGKKNKYLEVYTGDTLTRAMLTGAFTLC